MSSGTRIIRIGRGQGCDILLSHASVSRRHAEFSIEAEGSMSIRDLGSTGGTFVLRGEEELRVVEMELELADRVRLGNYEISVEDLISLVQDTHPPAKAAPPAPESARPVEKKSESGERPKTRMVRCDCGTIKERGKPCPSCGA